MDDTSGAAKGERTGERRGERSDRYGRKLTTRAGALGLRVPQDGGGLFRTEVFTRHQRSEKALLLARAEMSVQGRSARKVRSVTEELQAARWQRCYLHLLRNTLDHLPRSADRASLQELRWSEWA